MANGNGIDVQANTAGLTNYWHTLQQARANVSRVAPKPVSRYIVGSRLPYASHWIEYGYRDDPRVEGERVNVTYKTPGETRFMRDTLAGIRSRLSNSRTLDIVGARFYTQWVGFLEAVRSDMQLKLKQEVYDRPAVNELTGRTWERSDDLYNKIEIVGPI